MDIKKVKLSALKPLERNVRKHGDKQIEQFVESLKQFGQTRAFVIDEQNNVLVGNGMHAAMTRMGGWDKVDCHVVRGLSETEKKKLVLSDNKVFQLGADDYDAIEEMLKEFADAGDYSVAGYDADLIQSLARSTEEVMESMSNYGVLDDDEIQTRSETRQNFDYSDDDESPSIGTSNDETREYEPVEAQQTARRVVCPHCGGLVVVDD